jgi:hypothetical protein
MLMKALSASAEARSDRSSETSPRRCREDLAEIVRETGLTVTMVRIADHVERCEFMNPSGIPERVYLRADGTNMD